MTIRPEPLTMQEEQGKYKYYFLREDNPGKYKRLSDRLIKSFEKLRQGEREHTPHSHNYGCPCLSPLAFVCLCVLQCMCSHRPMEQSVRVRQAHRRLLLDALRRA